MSIAFQEMVTWSEKPRSGMVRQSLMQASPIWMERSIARSDDRTTNLSRLIIIGNLRIGLFSVATVRRGKNVWWGNQGILGVGNRHDNTGSRQQRRQPQ